MDERLSIIEECMMEIQKQNIEKFNKPMIITINNLSDKIQYNFVAKAYDVIYGLDGDELNSSEVVRILNANNFTYSYKGEVRNSSNILLFGVDL